MYSPFLLRCLWRGIPPDKHVPLRQGMGKERRAVHVLCVNLVKPSQYCILQDVNQKKKATLYLLDIHTLFLLAFHTLAPCLVDSG